MFRSHNFLCFFHGKLRAWWHLASVDFRDGYEDRLPAFVYEISTTRGCGISYMELGRAYIDSYVAQAIRIANCF